MKRFFNFFLIILLSYSLFYNYYFYNWIIELLNTIETNDIIINNLTPTPSGGSNNITINNNKYLLLIITVLIFILIKNGYTINDQDLLIDQLTQDKFKLLKDFLNSMYNVRDLTSRWK